MATSITNTSVTTDNLTVDTNVLHVDSTNNRVGIGTTSPAYNLDVFNPATSGAPLLAQFKSAGGDTQLYVDNNTITTQLTADSTNSVGIVGTKTNHPFVVRTNNAERLRIDTSGTVTMPSQPAFMAYKNGNQSLTAHTLTKITGWTEAVDQSNSWDNGTGTFTAPSNGVYLFGILMQSNVLGGLHLMVRKNGNNGIYGDNYLDGGDISGSSYTILMPMVANDYVEYFAYLTANGNINSNRSKVWAVKVG